MSKFTVTPEQIQLSNRKPDYAVERLEGETLLPHLFVEIKSLINSDFDQIMDQLHDTILYTVDAAGGNFSVFVIAMKASKIAFFQFYSYSCLLDEYGIQHYKGFIPINQLISLENLCEINERYSLIDMLKYIKKYNLLTDSKKLAEIGVESTSKFPHPHIFDALNEKHVDHVHETFMFIQKQIPGTDILD